MAPLLEPLGELASHRSSVSNLLSSKGAPSTGGPLSIQDQRRDSVQKIAARVQQQREKALERAAEVKVSEEWNDVFRSKGNLKDNVQLENFWSEVKARLIRRFGSTAQAFRALDSGDSSLSFLEFVDMLRMINLSLDQRVVRGLFEKASGGERAVTLEELKTILLNRTIRKLRFVMEGFNGKQDRVQAHIHRVVHQLCWADEGCRVKAVDRFQRKLSLEFCREIWLCLREMTPAKAAQGDDPVDRTTFAEAVRTIVQSETEAGPRMLVYETAYLFRIFDAVDQRGCGSVGINELSTALVLLSPEEDRSAKVALAFEYFDADADGCLLYEQIFAMFLCICSQRPLVEESLKAAEDRHFQEELSNQEGRRAYELALWHLQRTSKVEGGIVTKRELVEALQRLPALLDCLIPGSLRMRWAKDASPVEAALNAAPAAPAAAGHLHAPVAPAAAAAPPSSPPQGMARRPQSHPHQQHPQPHLPRRGGAQSATTHAERAAMSRMVLWDEVSPFRQTQTRKFQQTLRSLGDIRLAELTAGFITPPEVPGAGGEEAGAGGQSAAGGLSSSGGSRLGSAGRGGLRVSRSAPQLSSPHRPPSSAGGGAHRAGGLAATAVGFAPPSTPSGSRSPKKEGSRMRRAMSKGGEGGDSTGGGGPLGGGGGVGSYLDDGFEVAALPIERWGSDSAERFRLFAATTITSGRNWLDRPDPERGLWHKCYVCLRSHKLGFDCKT